jgi:hypothetical protein
VRRSALNAATWKISATRNRCRCNNMLMDERDPEPEGVRDPSAHGVGTNVEGRRDRPPIGSPAEYRGPLVTPKDSTEEPSTIDSERSVDSGIQSSNGAGGFESPGVPCSVDSGVQSSNGAGGCESPGVPWKRVGVVAGSVAALLGGLVVFSNAVGAPGWLQSICAGAAVLVLCITVVAAIRGPAENAETSELPAESQADSVANHGSMPATSQIRPQPRSPNRDQGAVKGGGRGAGKLHQLILRSTRALFGSIWALIGAVIIAVCSAWAVHTLGPNDGPTHQKTSTLAGVNPAAAAGRHAKTTGVGHGAPHRPTNVTLPSAFGVPRVGETMGCAYGAWSGDPAPTFSLRWSRDGAPIQGADAETYKVKATDQGHVLHCQVTAINTAGAHTATSPGVAVPTPPPTSDIRTNPAPLPTTSSTATPLPQSTKPKPPPAETKPKGPVVINDWPG